MYKTTRPIDPAGRVGRRKLGSPVVSGGGGAEAYGEHRKVGKHPKKQTETANLQ
jgi:hypothetical protein